MKKSMDKTRKYVYGIVGSANEESFGCIGIGNNEVCVVRYEDIGTAVSDVPESFKIDIEEAGVHEKTLQKIMETHTIIPIGFGVVAKDETEIRNVLKRARKKFQHILNDIDHKVQINVKISWDKTILASVLRENEEIRTLSKETKENSDQSLRIELGRKVKSALDRKRKEYMENIEIALKNLADGFRESKILDQGTLMNASFLVDKRREKEFNAGLEELERKYKGKLEFESISPLPPYNFVNIEMRRIDYKAIEEAREILDLGQEISMSEVNSAYNLLARECHPDLHPDDPLAEEKFKKLKNAHELLTKYCEHYLCSLDKSKIEETLLIHEKSC
jgi:hypothetical protein